MKTIFDAHDLSRSKDRPIRKGDYFFTDLNIWDDITKDKRYTITEINYKDEYQQVYFEKDDGETDYFSNRHHSFYELNIARLTKVGRLM